MPAQYPGMGYVADSPVVLARKIVNNTALMADGAQAPYTPSTPADWNGTPPTTISEALDRLAAVAPSPP